MESWKDQGVVLAARPHGESGAIVSILTEEQGRHAGSLVDICWNARVSDSLGSFQLELQRNYSARVLSDPIKLSAIQSACALCDQGLPEREKHPGLFYGLLALLDSLGEDIWGAAYIMWEIAFLKELGFSLDLTKCAGGGSADDLCYVSPKTGRAVSKSAGEPYKDKLIELPEFLKPSGSYDDIKDVQKGLKMTGYFLVHWAFSHHTQGVPETRLRFQERVENMVHEP